MPQSVSEPPATVERLHISITPFLRCDSLRLFSRPGVPTLLDQSTVFTTSGRSALALALNELGIARNSEVLIPAYHCLALSSPINSCGAIPVSYRTTSLLGIDLDDLKSKITPRTRCIVAVHFFGFPEALAELRSLCDGAGIALIEDCAHAFYGPPATTPIGQTGDFAIGSLMKFFPLFDGGCLTSSRRHIAGIRQSSRGILFQAKALVHIIERSATYSDSRIARLLNLLIAKTIARVKSASPELQSEIARTSPGAVYGSVDFEPEWADLRMSAVSRAVVRCVDHKRVIESRRANYLRLAASLSEQRGGRPFRPQLPDGVVPYVFPFLLEDPAVFGALRSAGVPLYRWEDVDERACEFSRHYKHSLVQFPCHQELSEQDLDALIATIRRVLRDNCSSGSRKTSIE